jgi:hypothetical protein
LKTHGVTRIVPARGLIRLLGMAPAATFMKPKRKK